MSIGHLYHTMNKVLNFKLIFSTKWASHLLSRFIAIWHENLSWEREWKLSIYWAKESSRGSQFQHFEMKSKHFLKAVEKISRLARLAKSQNYFKLIFWNSFHVLKRSHNNRNARNWRYRGVYGQMDVTKIFRKGPGRSNKIKFFVTRFSDWW